MQTVSHVSFWFVSLETHRTDPGVTHIALCVITQGIPDKERFLGTMQV